MESLVYVDHSAIRPGKAPQTEAAARDLVRRVEAAEPRALSYGIYFSEDGSRMTVIHVHPDSRSLEELMALLAPVLPPFRAMLELRSIEVFGTPTESVMQQLKAKVDLLGGTITIHRRVAGIEAGLVS